ncbi:DUF1036 domain-containing protein [Paenibacillus sp. P96]|uniref:DUF1036 domain-containing protein n=1 Tax=Paenibacillus zeirhizosphaerae TaxID=2987519 RepID=A0ABT9FNN0_9BACL|nr:DUF1036 domain-containing protein [Paenibacillus sp. P96]MDP4096330.1 DUF1036 domain-containing protein [Paenibacillus sp. P96]
MGLNFRNSTNSPVYVAYAYPNLGCRPVTFRKVGWYRIEPGQTRQVWIGYAGGNTFYYYAENDSGQEWSGSFPTEVPLQAFSWCWNTGCTTCRNVGFRELYVSLLNANYTINLISSSSQRTPNARNIRSTLPTGSRTGRKIVRKIPRPLTGNVKEGTPRLLNRTAFPARTARKR